MKQSGLGARMPGDVKTQQILAAATDAPGVELAQVKANAKLAQEIKVADDSAVAGVAVTFPPGSLAVDTTIAIEEAVAIASPGNAAELGLGDIVGATGKAVAVQSSVGVDPVQAFVVTLALPSTSGLRLADSLANLVVFYKVKVMAEDRVIAGIIPLSQLVIVGQTVRFETTHFGSYQAAFTKSLVSEATQVVMDIPVQTKRDTASLDPLTIEARSPFIVAPGARIEITGTNFRPTMMLAMGGRKVSNLEVLSDVRASFTAPSQDGLGLTNLTADQDGTVSSVSLYYKGDKSDFPVSTMAASEVCKGQRFYDATGTLRTGLKTCDQPNLTNLTAENLKAGVSVAGITGTLAPAPQACSSNAQVGCVTTTAYKSADLTNLLAANIKADVYIGGVKGTLAGGSRSCTSDGDTNCAVDGTTYAAAMLSGLAGKLVTGQSVAGVNGAFVVPAAGDVRLNTSFGVGSGVVGTLDPGSAAPANCNSDGQTNCVAVSSFPAVDKVNLADKLLSSHTAAGVTGTIVMPIVGRVLTGTLYGVSGSSLSGTLTLPTPGDVFAGVSFGIGGNDQTGTLTLASAANVRVAQGAFGRGGNSVTPSLGDCANDGASGCVTSAPYFAANTTGLAAKLILGTTVAGASGTVVVPSAGDVRLGVNFGAGSALAGTLDPGAGVPPNCSMDGATNCVAISSFPAANVAGLASKVLSSESVAGVAGTVALPAVGKVLAGISYGVGGIGSTGTLTLPSAGNVLTGSGTYGDPGSAVTPSLIPDFPSVGNVLSSDTVNGVSGTLTLPVVGKVLASTTYGFGGNGSTGTLTLPAAGNVLSGSGTYGDPGSALTPTLTLPAASNVLVSSGPFGIGGNGATPTLTLPSMGKVLASTSYGVGGSSSMGTLTLPAPSSVLTGSGAYGDPSSAVMPTLATCSADGATGCVTTASYKSANMAQAVAGNIKSGVTIAGISGSLVGASTCSSDGQQTCVVSGIFKAANVTGLSPWDVRVGKSLGGIIGELKTNCRNRVHSTKFNWDGVVGSLPNTSSMTGTAYDFWDSVDDYYGFAPNTVTGWSSDTVCDSSVWADVTTADGGSTTTSCAASGANCQYKDKISNLVVTNMGGTSNTWSQAVNTCNNSTYGGFPAGTWRLPTQKELMSLYEHGIASLAGSTNFISLAQMQNPYWSSSTTSMTPTYAWAAYPSTGQLESLSKTMMNFIMCVR